MTPRNIGTLMATHPKGAITTSSSKILRHRVGLMEAMITRQRTSPSEVAAHGTTNAITDCGDTPPCSTIASPVNLMFEEVPEGNPTSTSMTMHWPQSSEENLVTTIRKRELTIWKQPRS